MTASTTQAVRPSRPARQPAPRVLLAGLGLALFGLLAVGIWAGQAVCREPLEVRSSLEALVPPSRPASGPTPQASPSIWATLLETGRGWLGQAAQAALEWKDRDSIGYPAHALLAGTLERLGCSPYAVALQWLKAASHARGPDQQRRAATGLARQAARVGGGVPLAAFLGQHLDAQSDPRARCAFDRLASPTLPAAPDPCAATP